MKLSIIILNYKSAGLTRQCVKGIYAAKSALDFEVIVVDNASGDGLQPWLTEHYPHVKQISLPNNGKLEALLKFMDDHPQCGLAGPRLVNPDGSLQYSTYKFPSFWLPLFRRTFLGNIPALNPWLKDYQMMAWDHKEARAVDWLLGACLIVRRQAVEEVGLMDEQFFLYVEDTDWCRRFWASKWEVWYVASVELVHFHERLSAQKPLLSAVFSKITWIHISSWFKYFQKWK
ncbi:MAG: hypothetical protein UV92_C0042G0004 [Parcubacteria group bacterium GW2011_GWA1_43_27]|nr:MAG: hypothetical protein UV92_C0042G0004 [Parcubacteria group bacterium GW2011_GWA1_43_27]